MSESEVERFDEPVLGFLMEQKNALTARRPEILKEGDADTIDELDGTIEQVTAAINAIALAQHERQEGRERYAKWKVLLPACRAALEKHEQACRDVEKIGFKIQELQSRASHAFDVLCQIKDQRPQNASYPSDEEIEAHEARERKAEAIHKERVRILVDGKERQRILIREEWQARDELARLQFQERQNRPRETPTETSIGHLSGVR